MMILREKHFRSSRRALLALAAVFFAAAYLGQAPLAHAQEITLTPQGGLDQLTRMSPQLRAGTTVVLKPGVYTGTATLSGVHGAPGHPVVITAEKGALIESWKDKGKKEMLSASSLLVQGSSDVEIRGLDIAGASRGITIGSCTNVKVDKNHIHDINNYGVMNYMSSGTSIEDNVIERSVLEHGIYISGDASRIHVSGNTIRDTHINGIHLNGKIVAPVVENNILERTGSYPTKEGGAGITFIGGVTAPVAKGNLFKSIYGQGITIDAPNALIASNKFENYSWSAILALPGAMNMTLSENQFLDPSVIPLQLSGNVVGSLKASGDTYSIKGGRVVQDAKTEKITTLEEWRAMGRDAK